MKAGLLDFCQRRCQRCAARINEREVKGILFAPTNVARARGARALEPPPSRTEIGPINRSGILTTTNKKRIQSIFKKLLVKEHLFFDLIENLIDVKADFRGFSETSASCLITEAAPLSSFSQTFNNILASCCWLMC